MNKMIRNKSICFFSLTKLGTSNGVFFVTRLASGNEQRISVQLILQLLAFGLNWRNRLVFPFQSFREANDENVMLACGDNKDTSLRSKRSRTKSFSTFWPARRLKQDQKIHGIARVWLGQCASLSKDLLDLTWMVSIRFYSEYTVL